MGPSPDADYATVSSDLDSLRYWHAGLLLWFCYLKPRRRRDAALAADGKTPPVAPVGVRTAEPFDQHAYKDPVLGSQVCFCLHSPRMIALCTDWVKVMYGQTRHLYSGWHVIHATHLPTDPCPESWLQAYVVRQHLVWALCLLC